MKRLLALLALVGMVVVPPPLLLAWGFTDWAALGLWSASDVRVLLAVLTAVGWLAWALWVLAVLVEVVAAVSGGRVRVRLPGLDVPRALASGLIAAVLASGAASVAHAAPVSPIAATRVTGPVAPGPDTAPADAPSAPEGPRHTVVTGDDLWSLAERYYAEGDRWRAIVAANPSVLGDALAPLVAGTVLHIPDPVQLVTVRQGDTLSGLAALHLGDAARWPEIHRLNAQRVRDPDLILPGWVLRVPLLVSATPAATPADPAAPSEAPPEGAAAEAPPTPGRPPGGEAAATEQAPPPVERLAPAAESAPAARLVGGLAAISAAAVVGGLAVRRRAQEASRPVGRRYVQPEGALSRMEAALTRLASPQDSAARPELLARAMRLIARHWWERREPAWALRRALVGPDDLTFVFDRVPGSVPPGFAGVGAHLSISWRALAELADVDHPVAYPALVTLGGQDGGDLVMVDLMASGVLGIRDEGGHASAEVLSAMLVELACAPWSAELDLLVVTDDPGFARAAGDERVASVDRVEDGVATVERLVRERARFVDGPGWDAGRIDPDLAEAWAAQVVLFELPPDADQLARLEAAIAAHPCGVAAVTRVPAGAGASADWILTTDASGARRIDGAAAGVTPQTLAPAARRALTDLYQLASATDTAPAPWWHAPSEEPVNIIALRPAAAPAAATGPRLALLGPVQLTGCAGEPPSRAVRQCLEYCAWLALHPGSTPVQMAGALVVAEGTRRSNMSRLRSWLGAREDGSLYLPDAYSGRIVLHDDVTTDWHDLLVLTAGGVNRQSLDTLLAALELVRGAPLADAAPGQWGWAEEFRSDAASLVRDVGVVAARLARERGDLDTARWAANRALAASPDDELLLGERIRTEQAAGRPEEVRRLVQRVARTARTLEVDLLPETIDLCQEVIEGRRRARA